MRENITLSNIRKFNKSFNSSSSNQLARNALIQNDINKVAVHWENFSKINHVFSNTISKQLPVTNQKSSGRCWGFAGLNLLRLEIAKNYNLSNFEFSQNYFMFWDKLEKANYFLENILKTLDQNYDSRLMMHLLQAPVQDGGQWDMFVNLIEKYGLVPKSVMPETNHSSKSSMMNYFLTHKLRECAFILRKSKKPRTTIKQLRSKKEEMMSVIYSLLCMFLGNPPTKFDWSIKDKNNKFTRFNNLDPLDFYHKFTKVKLKNKVCLIHAPMSNKKMNELYTIDFLGNVVGGNIIKYANVEINELKKAAIKSIKNDEAVWFGCDVGKMFNRELGIMDMDLYDYEKLFDTKFKMNKASRLEYGDSAMTHAMLFTGVDLKGNTPTKWRVENSWGDKNGDKGYYLMSDSWFDEYNYEVVVDKKYLSNKSLEIFNRKPHNLEPWDPMGALAVS
ncbi:MAG: C1 family peptidase [Alphaproteobacteria bacterium]|nr:C1 family peptidase [Alphaproteobacteria bacterium]